ncbi:MAG: aminopeptidase P family protein, partial [Clostridia bacterium]|nr:aminopeptidase P family protein [Clostridia bacterium]
MNIKKLQEKLENNQAFLVSSPENRRYLTGFASSDGYLLLTKNEAIFLIDSRYIEAAQNRISECSEIVLLKSLSQQLGEYVGKLGIETVYTESERLSVSEFNRFCEAVPCECLAEKTDAETDALRRAKSIKEKEKILQAQAIAEKAFDHVLGFIKKGVTEREIALTLDFFMLRNGAECVSFETIAVSGKNSSMPHGVPGDRRIEKGDFITMDFGAVVDGYHSDMTRTVAFGEISSKQALVYETVLTAQKKSLESLRAGVSCRDADAAARDGI